MKMRFSLMEAVHYSGMLTESQRRDFVVKTYTEQLLAALGKSHMAADIQAALVAIPLDQHDENDEEAAHKAAAGRIVDYIAGFDPSNKKIYTLWMCQRFMKGEVSLDDLGGLNHYLNVFDANKSRIQLKDIGQYKTVTQLAEVIAQFEEKSVASTELTNNDDMQVVYESGNVQVVIPKSMEGAIALGETTIWCTAWTGGGQRDNRFKYYQQGVLYVTIDKAKKARWQFFLPNAQSNTAAEFMDRANKPVDLAWFFDTYPMVFKVIGEQALLPYINKIGLSYFSDAAIHSIAPERLPHMVKSIKDMAKLNPESLLVPVVARNIMLSVAQTPLTGSEAGNFQTKYLKPIVDYYVKSNRFDVAWWVETAERQFAVFPMLPDSYHTAQNKDKMVERMNSRQCWMPIENYIPKPWTDKIYQMYWDSKCANDFNLKIADVPEEYRSDTVIASILKRNPSEMMTYPKMSTEVAMQVITHTKWENIEFVPERFYTKELFDLVAARSPMDNPYGDASKYHLLSAFPVEFWDGKYAPQLLMSSNLTIDQIPESMRTEPNLVAWVKGNRERVLTIPAESMTPRVLSEGIFGLGSVEFVNRLTPEIATPTMVVQALAADLSFHHGQVWPQLPAYIKQSPIVIDAFAEKRVVPVKDMGKQITSEFVARRVCIHPNEIADIPANVMSPEMASAIIAVNCSMIVHIDDRYLTEPVLFTYLTTVANEGHNTYVAFGFAKKMEQFERFDKKTWTSRTLRLAIDLRFVEPDLDAIPADLMDSRIIAAVLRHNPDAYDDERSSALGDDDIIDTLTKNIGILAKIDPDKMTEGMAFTVLKSFASRLRYRPSLSFETGHEPFSEEDKKARSLVARIPKRLWSKRCWQEGVAYIEPLKQVPTRYLDDAMIETALKRDAGQIQYVPEATDWLTKNAATMLPGQLKDQRWLSFLNKWGVFKMGRDWIDAAELPRTKLPSGASFVYAKAQTNFRAYVFNKKGKLAADIYSANDALHTSRQQSIIENAQAIREMVMIEPHRFSFKDTDILAPIGIFGVGSGFRKMTTEDKLPRQTQSSGGKLKWALGGIVHGTYHIAYLADTKVMMVNDSISTAGFSSRNRKASIDDIENFVPLMKIWPMAGEIADAFNQMKLIGHSNKLREFGITMTPSKVWVNLIGEKLGGNGDLSVWRGAGTAQQSISVYHNIIGYLGGAKMLKNGTIKDLEMASKHRDFAKMVSAMLEAMSKNNRAK